MTTSVVRVPDPRQLVDVRLRRYVVVDVVQGTVPADVSEKTDTGSLLHPQSQHLVLLNSVEDDDLDYFDAYFKQALELLLTT